MGLMGGWSGSIGRGGRGVGVVYELPPAIWLVVLLVG